jgi:hypothetical protein
MVRLMVEADLPWLREMFRQRYPDRYNPITTEGWFVNIVLKNPLLFLPIRTDNALLIAMITCLPWLPDEFESNIVCICGKGWEVVSLLRASIEWAEMRKCVVWRLQSDTDFDIAPLAKRAGATEVSPRFAVRMRHG